MNAEEIELWNFCKGLDNIVSSTHYYTKEKYRNICEEILDNIWKDEFLKFKNEYKDPIKFVEDYLGCELKWYQKILLKAIYEKENLLYRIGRRY